MKLLDLCCYLSMIYFVEVILKWNIADKLIIEHDSNRLAIELTLKNVVSRFNNSFIQPEKATTCEIERKRKEEERKNGSR